MDELQRRVATRLSSLGLRGALVEQALGAPTAIHAAQRRAELTDSLRRLEGSPPGALVALLVGGRRLEHKGIPIKSADLNLLESAGHLELDDTHVWAPRALMPHQDALICAPWTDLPDDSSLHLLGALPPQRGPWLDVGTGSAFAPLLHARARTLATDVSAELIQCASISNAMSPRSDFIELATGDLFAPAAGERFALVSFNAPIDGASELLRRFWSGVSSVLAPGGVVVTHSIADADPELDAIIAALGGQFISCRYTPPNFRPSFAVSAWYSAGPHERISREAALSARAPHARRDWISPPDIG